MEGTLDLLDERDDCLGTALGGAITLGALESSLSGRITVVRRVGASPRIQRLHYSTCLF